MDGAVGVQVFNVAFGAVFPKAWLCLAHVLFSDSSKSSSRAFFFGAPEVEAHEVLTSGCNFRTNSPAIVTLEM